MLTFDDTLRTELPQARYLVLELAALLDRLDAAAAREGKTAGADARVRRIATAIATLASPQADRVEDILRADSET